MRLLFISALSISLFAGQSLRLTSETGTWTGGNNFSQPLRVEFEIHGIGSGPGNQNTILVTRSFRLQWNGGSGWWLGMDGRSIGTPCTINPASYPNGVVVRYQYDPSQGTYGKETCERWAAEAGGARTVSSQFYSGTYTATYGNQVVGQTNGEVSIAYLRSYDTLVAENSRRPLPADSDGNLDSFKFDGSLTNAGNGGNVTGIGSPVYVTTSPAPFLSSTIKVGGATGGFLWFSCRAGNGCTATGADSFATSDSSTSAATYFWQQVDGPTTIRWSSRTAASPTMTGLTFGSYTIRLATTASGGLSATTDLSFGVVPTDGQDVVVPQSTDAASIFGPMIAFGKNPVLYATERHKDAVENTHAVYTARGYATNPLRSWKTGTIAYGFPSHASVALTNSPGTSGTSLQFASLTAFDTSEFPFAVYTGNSYAAGEVILICSASGGTTLNVCSGGRGSFGTTIANLSSGNSIVQPRIKGTGTSFLTDLCNAGVGPAGQLRYTSANVTATNGSATLTNNVNWPSDVNCENCFVTVVGSGLDAVTGRWFDRVSGISGTSLTLTKAYPGTTGTVTVYVVNGYLAGSPVMEGDSVDFPKGSGATPIESELVHSTYGFCGTNTMASFWGGALEKWGTFTITGARWTTTNQFAANNTFSINYYDEVFGLYSQYFSSGNHKALEAARLLGDIWLAIDEYGSCCGQEFLLGPMVGATIDGRYTTAQWKKLRRFLNGYTYSSTYCQAQATDQRTKLGYQALWLAAASILDPDSSSRATWATRLQNLYDAYLDCDGSDSAYKQFVMYDGGVGGATATNGSATVTFSGPNWNTNYCGYVGSGVAQVSGDKRTVTKQSGDNWDGPSNRLVIFRGVRTGGIPWWTTYSGTGTTITLPEDYQFTTGVNVDYWIYTTSNATSTFGSSAYIPISIINTSLTDWRTGVGEAFFCRSDSTSQITLDRAYPGTTISGTGRVGPYITAGLTSQPVMTGLIHTAMAFAEAGARKAGNTTLADNFRTLLTSGVNWTLAQDGSGGWDPVSKGVFYTRGGLCDPTPVPTANGICWDAIENNRINQTETFMGASMRYLWNTGTTAYRDAGDVVYRATYNRTGDPTVWGIASDAYNPLSIFDFTNGRTFVGNVIGMGFGSSWPAARLGGVAAAVNRTLYRGFTLPSGAVDVQYEVIAPNGSTSTVTCSVSPCQITADARQGNYLIRPTYRKAGGATLSVGDQYIEVVQ